MNLLPVWKYSLAYGLSGSIHISSMPRVTLIAPGIVPSRHSSRGSLMSMKVTPGWPTSLIASAVGTVSISAVASSTIACTVFFILSGIGAPPPLLLYKTFLPRHTGEVAPSYGDGGGEPHTQCRKI